jgi:hypothetical protein
MLAAGAQGRKAPAGMALFSSPPAVIPAEAGISGVVRDLTSVAAERDPCLRRGDDIGLGNRGVNHFLPVRAVGTGG